MIESLTRAAKALQLADYVMYSSGAGMGVDSGLPDFRGNEGFWNNYPPYKNKFNFMECANPQFLESNPTLFWGFYGHRLNTYRQKQPHDGYNLLKKIALQKKGFFCVTSNVDGHFNRVFGEENCYEVHGSIHRVQCVKCSQIIANTYKPEVDMDTMACSSLPKCQKCGSDVRPNILMFNDYYWDPSHTDEQQVRFKKFIDKATDSKQKLTIVEIGAGNTIPTIRRINERILFANKQSTLIRINPQPEDQGMDFGGRLIHLKGTALSTIRKLYEIIQEKEVK